MSNTLRLELDLPGSFQTDPIDALSALAAQRSLAPAISLHPVVTKVVVSAALWFLAVTWLNFTGGPEIGASLAVATGFFVMVFTLILAAATSALTPSVRVKSTPDEASEHR